MMKTLLLALLMMVVFPALGFAQDISDAPTPNNPWYATTAGIAAATGVGVSLLKRLLGNVDGAKAIPTWLYAVMVSMALTAFAYYVLHTLEGEPLKLLWNSIVSASVASGFYEWLNNSTKPLSASARSAGVEVTP
jgi:hypothetical protein